MSMMAGSPGWPVLVCSISGLLVDPRICESGLSVDIELGVSPGPCDNVPALPFGLLSVGDRLDGEVAMETADGIRWCECRRAWDGDAEREL